MTTRPRRHNDQKTKPADAPRRTPVPGTCRRQRHYGCQPGLRGSARRAAGLLVDEAARLRDRPVPRPAV